MGSVAYVVGFACSSLRLLNRCVVMGHAPGRFAPAPGHLCGGRMLPQASEPRQGTMLAVAGPPALSCPSMAKKRSKKKNPVAVALAKMRARRLTPEQRSEIARKAALARWRRKT